MDGYGGIVLTINFCFMSKNTIANTIISLKDAVRNCLKSVKSNRNLAMVSYSKTYMLKCSIGRAILGQRERKIQEDHENQVRSQ